MNVREVKSRNKISLGQDGNALINLIIFNAILYILLKFIFIIYRVSDLNMVAYDKNIFNWFSLPADLGTLGSRPWTILSYMFTHKSFFHLLGNVFFLWSFGYILQELTGNRKLIPIYIYGGLAGAFFYVLSYHIFPALQPQLPNAIFYGANASVMAVAVATTTISPDYRIFPMINGGIPLWIVTLVYVIIDFTSISLGDPAKYIAHFSGAALGFLFIYQLRKGNDWSEWMNNFFDWVENLFNPDKKNKAKSPKEEFFYKVKDAQPYKKTPNVTQKRVDEILDKINQKGFHFLTDEEKDILKRAAKGDDL
ncbi:MAG: rhomboid family intramembrane serine protease [Chitinophagaceae bacterium]